MSDRRFGVFRFDQATGTETPIAVAGSWSEAEARADERFWGEYSALRDSTALRVRELLEEELTAAAPADPSHQAA